jgi:6,7-dimethyl-8-ribityllumazine synthase
MSQRYLIVAAKFNELITKALVEGAKDAFQEAGVATSDVDLVWVPGAFEIPTVAAKAARTHGFKGIVCLGAVIRGETPHFDYVAGQAAAGCQQVGIETGVPVIFGVLTTDTAEQALARCGIKSGNKGAEAARAAIQTAKTLQKVEELARR